MSDSIEKLKLLFFSPTKFFQSVKHEKTVSTPLVFYGIIASILLLIEFIVARLEDISLWSGPGLPPLKISFLIFSIVFLFLIPFILTSIIHIWVVIFGGRKGVYNTFKPLIYSLIIAVFYIFLILIVNSVYFIRLVSGSYFYVILSYFIITVGFIHTMNILLTGISIFQNMNKIRAGILLIPALMLIVLAGLIVFWIIMYLNTGWAYAV